MEKFRNLSLKSHGISEYLYREMVYFCLQYPEKKSVINSSINDDSDYINKLKSDVFDIEEAAKKTDSYLANYIIKNIAKGIPYEHLNVPCGRRQFYEKRKQFFINLCSERNKLI